MIYVRLKWDPAWICLFFSRPLKGIFLYDKSSGDFRMSEFGRRESKFQVQSQQTATVLKMKDPLSTCCVSISFKTRFISQDTLDQNINMNPTVREGSWVHEPVSVELWHGGFSVFQYNQLYQNVKRLSKTGEYFCKELMMVFQQR